LTSKPIYTHRPERFAESKLTKSSIDIGFISISDANVIKKATLQIAFPRNGQFLYLSLSLPHFK
jgi:hypothetical protein